MARIANKATLTNVADLDTNQTLLAANIARRVFSIYNDSTVTLYVKFGLTATTTSWTVKLLAEDFYESPDSPVYLGIVDGIWASNASGSARVTELA